MEHLVLSCIESRIESNRSLYSCFHIASFDRGQGITVANALRRTLLSELTSLAIVCVEIQGVSHEYSNIKGVRESVLDILLNLKQIVFVSTNFYTTPEVGFLKIQGPAIIKSRDLKLPTDLQCVDPNQYIATLSDNSSLEMKFMICRGKAFVIETSFQVIVKKFKFHFCNKQNIQSNISLLNKKKILKVPNHETITDFKKVIPFSKLKTPDKILKNQFSTSKANINHKNTKSSENIIKNYFQKDRNKTLMSTVDKKFFKGIEKNLLSSNFSISKSELFENFVYKQNLIKNIPTNVLLVDSVFMPVVKVNFSIQNIDNFYKIQNKTLITKFQKKMSQEKIILEVWTNGSIDPKNAISIAAQQIIDIFIPFQKTYLVQNQKNSTLNINYLKSNNINLKTNQKNKIINKTKQTGSVHNINFKKNSDSSSLDSLVKKKSTLFSFKTKQINQPWKLKYELSYNENESKSYGYTNSNTRIPQKKVPTFATRIAYLSNLNRFFDEKSFLKNLPTPKIKKTVVPVGGTIAPLKFKKAKHGKILIKKDFLPFTVKLKKKSVDIIYLNLPDKFYICLKRANINTIYELTQYSKANLLSIKGFSQKAVQQLNLTLEKFHLKLENS